MPERSLRAMSDTPSDRAPLQIFWLSFSILFLELAMIRYIPSYFRMLSFFSNFLLLSCFFGMSLGMLHQRGRSLFPWTLALSALAIGFITWERPGANINFKTSTVLFFGSEFFSESHRNFPLMLVLLSVFAVFGTIFYGLGQELMARLKGLSSLQGYSVNLWGSLAGSLTFTLMSVYGVHPALWFLVAACGLLPCWPSSGRARLLFVVSTALLVAGPATDHTSQWSPYNRVELRVTDANNASIYVNGISHQAMFPADQETGYAIPYRAYMSSGAAAPEVVIVGAGSGNDVSAALACGVKHVEAVEIDPIINQLGIDYHPRKPYQDPRVNIHIMDGRRFLRTFRDKVDVVSFGLVDSLTLLSGFSSTRLENNLFTQDSFGDAKALLRPGGILVVYNDFRECWLVGRYYHQLANLFGPEHVLLVMLPARSHLSVRDGSITASAMLIAGNIEPIRAWLNKREGGSIETKFDDTWNELLPATDDWPFPYLRKAEIPSHNLWSAIMLLVLSGLSLRLVLGSEILQIHWKMFWLGAGFMLIETRGIGRMSLLFGTSWQGSSLSILAILLLALLANGVARQHNLERLRPMILGGLLFCLLLDGLIPTNALLDLPLQGRLLASLVILFSPMFFSGLLFSQALRSQENAARAIGSNLLGAMLGGSLENLATVLGMKGLLVLAAAIYLLAYRVR